MLSRLITDNVLIIFEIFYAMKRKKEGQRGSMVFKLDISKVYDRIEWFFLKKFILKIGFSEKWVGKIMECVSTVFFSFFINWVKKGKVIFMRGFRQGDHIFSYLFILYVKVFSRFITKAANEGFIYGVQVCRRIPIILYLLITDDNILFSRVIFRECFIFADIIGKYERVSRQKINFIISKVIFSVNVDAVTRSEIIGILNVAEVQLHEKYFGLFTIIGRVKKAMFAGIKERVWKKV